MNSTCSRATAPVLCPGFAIAFALVGPVLAQVPAGWWISAHQVTPTSSGPAGLWLHHPAGAVPSIPVTGLSADLMGTGLSSGTAPPTAGSASVALAEATGTIVYVGEVVTGTANPLELHRITLSGSAAVSDDVVGTIPVYLGTSPTGVRSISSLAPTGLGPSPASEPYILMTLPGQPPGAPQLAIYHTLTGLNLVPPLYGLPPGTPTAVAYVSSYPGTTIAMVDSGVTTIVQVNLTFGSYSYQVGPVTTLATIPASVAAMDFDTTTGLIYCACDAGPAPLYTVNATTGAVTAIPAGGPCRGVAWERDTNMIAAVGSVFGPGSLQRSTFAGATTFVAAPPAGGWSTPSALDLRPIRRLLDAGSGAIGVQWNTPWSAPAAGVGNLPFSGNAGWGLSVSPSIFAPITALIGISVAESPFPLPFGIPAQMIRIDLAPGSFLGVLSATGFGVAALPFPIPPGFVGTRLYFQALCSVTTVADPVLTDALEVTIL